MTAACKAQSLVGEEKVFELKCISTHGIDDVDYAERLVSFYRNSGYIHSDA